MASSIDLNSDVHQSSSALLGRLLRENVRRYWGWIALALVAMAVMAAATAASAWLMEPVVNEIFVDRNEDMLWPVGLAVLAVFAIKGISNYIQATLMARVGLRIIADNQNRLYRHLTTLDLQFFQDAGSGGLVSRFLIDIGALRAVVSNALTSLGKDLLTLIGLLGVTFYQDWQLALIAFVVFPIALYPIIRLGRRMRKVTANTQHEWGLMTALLEETIQGIRLVKAYGMEAYEAKRVGVLVEKLFGLSMKAERTRAMASPIMETLGGFAVAIVILYGGHRVIQDQMDAGSFFSFITALLLAYEPMKRLANLNATIQQGLASAQRLFALLDTAPSIQDRPGAAALATPAKGRLALEDVHFAYNEDAKALFGVSIDLAPGETAALVGMSGSGKSTIMNLIPRFYEAGEGRVTVDGQDIRDVTMESLRANIALVSQEVTLFDDTVRANIAYGRPGASEEDIIGAAKAAAAHDFIEALPQGYDTFVGEMGTKLSGGQRQRLAIARAILKDAPILLLDEATSALDTESERHIQSALDGLMADRTTLVIAHRLSTVVGADRIYVLHDGLVAEQGTHAELLGLGGRYKNLHDLQLKRDEELETAAPAADETREDGPEAVRPARAAGS